MNKEELKYIKENYYAKPPSLDFLYEMIDEVMETESSKRLLREQMENSSLTMQVIPEISVSELGWTDVRTVGDQEVSGPARQQLLQFLSNIQGGDLQSKLKSLADFYSNPDSVNLEGETPGEKIANILSYLVFYKTLTKVISNFNAASAGFNFEAFLAVLLEGQQIPANTGTIADFTAGDNTPISLKLYAEKSLVVGGSFVDLVGDLTSPQFSPHDFMQYVVVLKSFEEETQGLDVKGQLKFYRFNFTLDNVANIVLNSMEKSVKCIEIPNMFIQEVSAGNSDYDYGATLPSQENLPSTEEMETDFVKYLEARLSQPFQVKMRRGGPLSDYNLEVSPEEIKDFTKNPLDWANNDDLFKAYEKFPGAEKTVVRGKSKINKTNAALRKAIATTFGESGRPDIELKLIAQAVSEATEIVNRSYSATMQKDKRRELLRQPGVFATPQESVEFYNSLTDPELKKRALLNSRGVLSSLQFDLNRRQVLNIESHAGEYSALPSGQSSVDIGTIFIGAEYVQEVLNRLTQELNQSIFAIFQSVKDITEGTYAFMAGGLQDDGEAQKAINASRSVEEKTQELRPGGGGTSGGSSGVIDTRMGAGRPTKPFKFPAE
tara:strand:+ start:325 stop:2142 length:1818 start_codon:yes stop_codon:yes gene_type:complete